MIKQLNEKQKKILKISGIVIAALVPILVLLHGTIKELLFVMVTATIEWIINYCNFLGWAI